MGTIVDIVGIANIDHVKILEILPNRATYVEMGVPERTRGGVPQRWDAILEPMGDIVDIANMGNIVEYCKY